MRFRSFKSVPSSKLLAMAILGVFVCGSASQGGAAPTSTAVITRVISNQVSRKWTDNTGQYQVQGALVGMGPQHIRIFKANGRYSTVSTDRLSRSDQNYVEQFQLLERQRHDSVSPRPLTIESRRLLATQAPSTSTPTIQFDPRWSDTDLPEGYVMGNVVYLRISRDLMANLARRTIRQTDVVRETILGYPVRGMAYTTGLTDVRLLTGSDQASFEIPVRGTVRSQSTTFAGSIADIEIYSFSTTQFQRMISITLNERGINIEPQSLRSQTQRMITGIGTSFGLLFGNIARQIAYQQALATKDQFDCIANDRTDQTINQEIDSRVRNAVNVVNRFVDIAVETFEKVPEPLQLRPKFRTSQQHLSIFLSRPFETASMLPPTPPPVETQPPFVAQIHASLIRDAISEREVIELLRPVVERLASQSGEAIERIREQIREGEFATPVWSPDGSWVTVYWYPRRRTPSESLVRGEPRRLEAATH